MERRIPKIRDKVDVGGGRLLEILRFDEDEGTLLSGHGWVCASTFEWNGQYWVMKKDGAEEINSSDPCDEALALARLWAKRQKHPGNSFEEGYLAAQKDALKLLGDGNG